eukprot:CAMPEP_0202482828 /NCGR_PEP_ID=MMETSP1361-20130828/2205_1 /ASSEMBLY_ACC=CAM_ASM_000849 /TAXON_ID=210615 /ORGANISM="Staurosira complex sp., Strain CCMP2646" /LENGTH=86 /DNA_ID=CAMNT_0049110879 /DNA_START=252 /DNA_END=513 /DNA_ORIENTATION=+
MMNFKKILLLGTLFLITLCGSLAHKDSPKGAAAAIDKDAAVTNLRGGGGGAEARKRITVTFLGGVTVGAVEAVAACGTVAVAVGDE